VRSARERGDEPRGGWLQGRGPLAGLPPALGPPARERGREDGLGPGAAGFDGAGGDEGAAGRGTDEGEAAEGGGGGEALGRGALLQEGDERAADGVWGERGRAVGGELEGIAEGGDGLADLDAPG
jgi:hypothetical protein